MKNQNQTYKQGDRVRFVQVTRKYACRGGIVKRKVDLFTDDSLKYPNIRENHPFSDAINLYGRRSLRGYVVDALNYNGDHVETVTVVDSFIAGLLD